MTRLVVVGGGKMGEALVTGLVTAGWGEASDLCVVEKGGERREGLATMHIGLGVADSIATVPAPIEGAVIAVKPGDVDAVCVALGARGVKRILSIAAGVTIATIEGPLADGVPVVRAMPNTPALVGAGA